MPAAVAVSDVDEVALVAEVVARGVDLSAPVALSHVLLVHDPAAAERLADAVRHAGYDVAIDTSDGGWTWIVRAHETALLTAAHSAEARARLGGLAARHGAGYEGWVVGVG